MKKITAKIYCKRCNFGIVVSNSLTIFLEGVSYTSYKSISDELGIHKEKNKNHTEFDVSTLW